MNLIGVTFARTASRRTPFVFSLPRTGFLSVSTFPRRLFTQDAVRPVDAPFLRCYIRPYPRPSFWKHPILALKTVWRILVREKLVSLRNRLLLRRSLPGYAFAWKSLPALAEQLHSALNTAIARHDLDAIDKVCTVTEARQLKSHLKDSPVFTWKREAWVQKPKLLATNIAPVNFSGNEFFIQCVVRLHSRQSVQFDSSQPKSEDECVENIVLQQKTWVQPREWKIWGFVPSCESDSVKMKLPDGQVAYISREKLSVLADAKASANVDATNAGAGAQ
ncbi:respiratory complex assembly protein [Schizosaccharomyces japonicus yFS275]|uniref:Respiratory complex assembly protein n=1 Tax=Schizosaccharomyces japonicus (strain yFS275 / FY16936) TaxID=402676 RepID=B6JZ91_SCHJY|nr:respiratory complex assembly protein [Schizosaccharomyces japonicus yFS275]EEB06859.1 respiratory complex assembly protein [Schizosaccharomyces japonicus yFS275]